MERLITIIDHTRMKRGFFPLDQKCKRWSIVTIWLFRMWFYYFFIVIFLKTILYEHTVDCRNLVCNISGTFQEMIVQGICQKKSTMCQGLMWAEILSLHAFPSLSPRVITWFEPTIQWKAQYLVSSQLKKKTEDLDKLLTWARNMVMWSWSANTLFWQLSIDHNVDV